MADFRVSSGGDRHYYRDGNWYRHDSRGREVVVTTLNPGVYIEALPPQHETIVIQGASYYHDSNYYYKQAPRGGYVVVAPPANDRGDRGDNGRHEGDQNHHR